jgi:hypothetical protein
MENRENIFFSFLFLIAISLKMTKVIICGIKRRGYQTTFGKLGKQEL